MLIENAGHVVSTDELIDTVWRKRFVAPKEVTRAIARVRAAIGDDPDTPTVIETVHKRGYRFLSEVQTFELSSAADRAHTRPRAGCGGLVVIALLALIAVLVAG